MRRLDVGSWPGGRLLGPRRAAAVEVQELVPDAPPTPAENFARARDEHYAFAVGLWAVAAAAAADEIDGVPDVMSLVASPERLTQRSSRAVMSAWRQQFETGIPWAGHSIIGLRVMRTRAGDGEWRRDGILWLRARQDDEPVDTALRVTFPQPRDGPDRYLPGTVPGEWRDQYAQHGTLPEGAAADGLWAQATEVARRQTALNRLPALITAHVLSLALDVTSLSREYMRPEYQALPFDAAREHGAVPDTGTVIHWARPI
jgi:hypothetical protein